MIFFILLLAAFLAGAAQAQDAPLPMPRSMWISDNPADLAPLAGTVWEFTTYPDGTDPASTTVIFTDRINVSGNGTAVLATMYPDCVAPPGPYGPMYEFCGGTMYVQYEQSQRELFDNLDEFGFAAVLWSDNWEVTTWYWFNVYENGLGEPGLAIGYSEFAIAGLFFPPTFLEGWRIYDEDDLPEDDPPAEE